jgi:uncharacterized protein involved in exopolysaccharide biosynthesis
MQTRIQEDLEVRNSGSGRYFGSVRRNAGWIFACAFAGLVVSVVVAYLWPDTYESTATLFLSDSIHSGNEPPMISVRKIASNVESPMAMESIVQVFGLYPNERKHLPIEDVVENMKRQIRLGLAGSNNASQRKGIAFQISFAYPDRVKARNVVRDLVARFISAAVPVGGGQAAAVPASGGQPFKEQLETAQKDLETAESKLNDFRKEHDGHLPDQAEPNLRKMIELETRRTTVQTNLSRAKGEQAILESSLSSDQEKRRNIKEYIDVPAPPRVENKQVAAYNKQIQEIELRIKTLKEQYTENFPDVKDARQRLAAIKEQRDALVKEDAANAPGPTRKADPEAARLGAELDVNIRNFQSQIASKANEISALNNESSEVDQDIAEMKARLEKKPDVEKQYTDLIEDRDLKKAHVDEAEIKLNASLQGGLPEQGTRPTSEALEQIDPPSLPNAPISPNRQLMIGAGTSFGMLIGFILAAMRPQLAAPSPRGWLGWIVGLAIGITAMVSSVAYYYTKSS